MKGVVLAGGTGSRLRPLTYTMPKQMIPVGGKPVLEYAISDLAAAGVTDIAVVLGEHGREEIREHFGGGGEFGVDITYVRQGKPLGLGHAVGCVEEFVGDEPFVLFLGDDLVQSGVTELVTEFNPETHTGSVAVKPVENPSRYGIARVDADGDVVEMVEKPDDPPSDLAGIGIFVLTRDIFDAVAATEPSWRGEVELSDAIHHLLSNGDRFSAHTVDGWWHDVGTPADVLAANRSVLDDSSDGTAPNGEGRVAGYVSTGNGTVVHEDAEIRGPVSLGDDVEVRDGAVVGPYTTLGDDCTVAGATIQSSVVLSGTAIETEDRLVDSIIGRDVTVGSSGPTRGTQLVVGTDSEVSL